MTSSALPTEIGCRKRRSTAFKTKSSATVGFESPGARFYLADQNDIIICSSAENCLLAGQGYGIPQRRAD